MPYTHILHSIIGERERANLVVRTARSWTATYRNTRRLILRTLLPFFVLHRLPYRNTRLLILRRLVQFYILPHAARVFRVLHCRQRLRLSKQLLENGSSRPRAFEAAERGKHAYPDSDHQAYPREWASNS